MNPVKFSPLLDAMPVIERRAKQLFLGRPNGEELVCDAVSLGWEYLQKAQGRASPTQLAYYACMHAVMGKQFGLAARCIGTRPWSRKHPQIKRTHQVGRLVNRRFADPAALAAVKVDVHEWRATLTDRECKMLDAFLRGESTQDVAREFGLSPARVSQVRRELVTFWRAFTTE